MVQHSRRGTRSATGMGDGRDRREAAEFLWERSNALGEGGGIAVPEFLAAFEAVLESTFEQETE